jgi:hypothetical protein
MNRGAFRVDEPTRSDVMLKPFLARYATERTPGSFIEGFYSEARSMWVVETADGLRPIIETSMPSLELVTKTASEVEQDDERQLWSLELLTKTDSAQESDDKAPNNSLALELSTKTEAEIERDDNEPTSLLM